MTPRVQSVRDRLVEATRAKHDSLHHDAVLGCLTDPHVTEDACFRALAVFQTIYFTLEAERRRLDAWGQFSLAEDCRALDVDLGAAERRVLSLRFPCRIALLGGLYVAHGAAFGRVEMARNVGTVLPHVSRQFLSRRMKKDRWRQLVGTLNRIHVDAHDALFDGADAAFAAVGALATVAGDTGRRPPAL